MLDVSHPLPVDDPQTTYSKFGYVLLDFIFFFIIVTEFDREELN